MRGQAPKPVEQRLRRNKRADAGLLVVQGSLDDAPEPSDGWCRQTVEEWYEFWTSPLALLVNADSDIGALRRLFDYKDEMTLALAAFRGEGAMERRTDPFNAMVKLEKMITPLEDRFGMSPVGRLRLGATLSSTSKTLSQMNSQLDQEVADGDDDTDPRDILDATTAN